MRAYIKKAFLKAFTWRLVATAITGVIAFSLTGSLALGVGIAGIDAIAKVGAFVLHELAWEGKGDG